jgi:hypothetical protein
MFLLDEFACLLPSLLASARWATTGQVLQVRLIWFFSGFKPAVKRLFYVYIYTCFEFRCRRTTLYVTARFFLSHYSCMDVYINGYLPSLAPI